MGEGREVETGWKEGEGRGKKIRAFLAVGIICDNVCPIMSEMYMYGVFFLVINQIIICCVVSVLCLVMGKVNVARV